MTRTESESSATAVRHKVLLELGDARAAVRAEARVRPRQLAVVDERDVRHEATQALPRHCHLRAVMSARPCCA